ncbi:MAG TPA: hypothetical protein VGM54_05840 [Chthoniobacter sp.]|jgi:hypothetical protein
MKLLFAILALSGCLTGCSLLGPDPRAATDPRYSAYPLAPSFAMRRDPGVDNTPLNMGNLPQDNDPHTMRYSYGW